MSNKKSGLYSIDKFDDCVVGITENLDAPDVIVYDYDMMLAKIRGDAKCTMAEAVDYFCYNIAGAYVGERMPIFIKRMSMRKIKQQAKAGLLE